MRVRPTRRLLVLAALAGGAVVPFASAGGSPDLDPPVVVVQGATGAWSNAAGVTVTATADDPDSGVATVEYRTSTDGGGSWTSPAVGTSVDVTGEGTTLVQFRATDNASNVSGWSSATAGAGGSVRIDRTGPTAPGAPPDQIPGAITWLDASDGSSVTTSGGAVTRWADRSGNGNDATQSTPANRPTLVSNAQNGRAVVRFASGGGQWLVLPSLAPRTILLTGRKQAVGNGNVVIGAGGANDSYLAFGTSSGLGNAIAQIGAGAALAPSGSEVAWQVLGGTDSGSQVTAWRNGTAGTPAATGGATWTVDSLALNPSSGYRLAGDLGEVVLFDRVLTTAERQLLEGYLAWRWGTQTALPAGHPYLGAAPGAAGGSLSWTTSAPRTVSVTGGSDALSGVASYEYRTSVDGGASWSDPQAGASVAVSTDGETLVQFRAVDAAGNVSTWAPTAGAAAGTVRIDRAAPTVSVSGATGTWTNAATVSVTASPTDSASGVASTQYRTSYNGGAWSAPASGTTALISSEGETLVQFRATDNAGNVSAWTSATSGGAGSVRIDRTAPTGTPVVTGATGAWSAAASASVTASGGSDAASGVSGLQYRTSTNGGSSWSVPQTGASVLVSAEGETLVQFRALDTAGNAGAWSTATPGGTGSVRLDRTAPGVPSVTGGGASWSTAASEGMTGSGASDTGSGVQGYEWATSTDGGGSWGGATSGATATISAQGETLVRFRSVDVVGNRSAWTAPATVRLDRTLPTVAMAGATGTWTNAATVTVTGTPSDPLSGVASTQHRLSTDGGASWSSPAGGASVDVTDEGVTLVQFRATDNAGNVGAWTAAVTGGNGSVRIDRTVPTVSASGADGQWASAPSRTVTAVAGDDAAGVAGTQYRTSADGGGTWGPTTSGGTVVVTDEGTTLVQFRATDAAGNTSGWTAAAPGGPGSVRLDRTSPSLLVSGADGTWTSAPSVTVTASAADGGAGVAGYEARTSSDGGGSWGAPQATATLAVTAEGTTLVQFRATDGAGNTTPWSGATPAGSGGVRIDRTPPVVTVTGADGQWSNAASVTVSASASDAGSGAVSYGHRVSTDGGAGWSAESAGPSLAVTGEGETLVAFRATDAAGNTSAWTPATPGGAGSVRLDRAPPGAPLMIVAPDTGVPVNASRGAVTISTARAPSDSRSVRVVVTQGGRLVHDGAFGTVRDDGLLDGTAYTYQAVAYDRLGNASPVNEARITTPDRTPPSQPPAPDAAGWPLRLTWNPAGGASVYRVVRDGVVIATPSSPAFTDPGARDVTAPVAPGGVASEPTDDGVLLRWMPVADRGTTYRYQVVATDPDGNTNSSPEVVLEALADGVTYEAAVDGSPVAAAAAVAAEAPGVRTRRVPVPPGIHEVTLTAVDAAGNRSTAARLSVRGPDPGPTRLTARASDSFARPGRDITFTAQAPANAAVRWTFPDGRVMTGARVTRSFGAGAITAQVTARMPDGLELATQVVVVVDGSVPALEARMTGRRLRVVPQDATGLASLTAAIDSGRARPLRTPSLLIPEGRHRVRLVATDAAGNVRRMTVAAVVDTRGPTVTARASARPGRPTGTVVWAARDGASGVAGVAVGDGPRRGSRGSVAVPAGRVAVLVASDRFGNTTRLAAAVPAPMRLNGLRDPGLQGRGDRLLPGGGVLTGIRAVVLAEARTRLVWSGALPAGRGTSGRYDPTIRRAVERFQWERRVREPAGRGVLGPATLRAMDRLVRWGGWGAEAGRG